ncbi:carbohydrate ABC transporter membrane protein 1 (CUT1 family) [Hydrogenispora ethanolica]|uniref:Carbohydrate ABC transporter membrane protein 1 (CUT1 family) n=1 Tax=Hydrogenispora ethanolica TaxID=1082276 RepID=A0A4R1S776_HYDET|nr:sugar ABC transporter permease [Hydrogenispora ethanolica]TCL75243.1 carbohydrate ABC transporter membrane protein 1 (CUT1 family) [Hydrogenispora ethanolica]
MRRNPMGFLIAIMLPAFLFLGLVIFFPVIKGILIAFQNYNLNNDLSLVRFNGLDNFKAILTDPNFNFWRIIINTLIWIYVSLFFQFVLGFILALLLREPFRGRGVYSGLVFYPWALSGFAIGLIWAWIFNGQFGMANDILMRLHLIQQPIGFLSDPSFAMISVIIVNIWYGVPFFAIMLLAALQSIPKELFEAAQIDGANSVKRLFYITIPYIKATIVSTVLLRTIWIMNFPEIIYAMTGGGPNNATNILATQMINKILKFYDYGQGSAMGVIIMVLLFACAIIYLRASGAKEEGAV